MYLAGANYLTNAPAQSRDLSMSLQDNLLAEQGKLATLADEMDAISAAASGENRELTADEVKLLESYPDKIDTSMAKCESLKKSVAALGKLHDRRTMVAPAPADFQPAATVRSPISTYAPRSRYFKSTLDCFQSGMFISATVGKQSKAIQYCRDNGVGSFANAMEEGTDTLGGFTVPDPLAATIIELFEQFSSFRSNARPWPMTSDTQRVPKLPELPRTEGHPDSSLTVVYPDEGAAITPSDLTFEQVSLLARKSAQLALWSTELDEDSLISMTDLLSRDIARNFAWDHDRVSFLGDGTGTYNSVTGVFEALQPGATVTLGAGSTAATDIELVDLNKMLSILSDYPGLTPKYYMHKSVFWDVVVPLLQAAGGTNMPQIQDGPNLMLNGYPVVITQILPKADAAAGTDLIVCGDLDLGAYSAIRREVRIRVLTELYAASDQLGIVSTMRGDSVTHSVGDADNCGCISKLKLAAV
jgi:HK97 family phage major capsid protein